MKLGTTLFLRGVILLIGLVVLALCLFALPAAIVSDNTGMYRPIVIGMYVPAVPFFAALYQALKLLHYIDINQAFSAGSVAALRIIQYCALAISVLYALGLPYIYHVADRDDAPGVMAIGLAFTFIPLVVAVFGAVFRKLLQSGMNLKAENDLTV